MQATSRCEYLLLLDASKGQSRASCDVSGPYILSAIHDQEGADEVVELRLMETFVTKHMPPLFSDSCPSCVNGKMRLFT